MSIGLAVYNRLSTDDGVKAIVESRIFPEFAKQHEVFPFITFSTENYNELINFSGTAGLISEQVTIRCIDMRYDRASDLAEIVRASIDEMGGIWGGITVNNVFLDDRRPGYYIDPQSEELLYYYFDVVATFWYGTIVQGSPQSILQTAGSYVQSFNATSDWGTPVGGKYLLRVNHQLRSKNIVVEVWSDTLTESVYPSWIQLDTNTIEMRVTSTPDLRFAGRAVVIATTVNN